MTVNGWLQILAFCALLIILSPLLGRYMAKVYTGERVFLTPVFGGPSGCSTAASSSIRSASRTGSPTRRA